MVRDPNARPRSVSADFVAGASAALRGLRLAASTAEVRKTYLQLVAAVVGIAGVFDVLGIWAVLHLTARDGTETWWAALTLVLLRIAGIGIVLLAAPLLGLFAVNVAFPLLGERVFYAGMAQVAPERASELRARPGMPPFRAVLDNLVRFILFVGLGLASFVVSLVPVVGAVAGPVLQAYFTARALGWELLDPWFDKLEMQFDAQHDYVRRHRAAIVGFGFPLGLVMAVPLVGPLVFGLAQAAAGVLVTEVLDPDAVELAETAPS